MKCIGEVEKLRHRIYNQRREKYIWGLMVRVREQWKLGQQQKLHIPQSSKYQHVPMPNFLHQYLISRSQDPQGQLIQVLASLFNNYTHQNDHHQPLSQGFGGQNIQIYIEVVQILVSLVKVQIFPTITLQKYTHIQPKPYHIYSYICLLYTLSINYKLQHYFLQLFHHFQGWQILYRIIKQLNCQNLNIIVYQIAMICLQKTTDYENVCEQTFIQNFLNQQNWATRELQDDIQQQIVMDLAKTCLLRCEIGRLEHLINFGLFQKLLSAELLELCKICLEKGITSHEIQKYMQQKWRHYFSQAEHYDI